MLDIRRAWGGNNQLVLLAVPALVRRTEADSLVWRVAELPGTHFVLGWRGPDLPNRTVARPSGTRRGTRCRP